jgi:hypothetical protein
LPEGTTAAGPALGELPPEEASLVAAPFAEGAPVEGVPPPGSAAAVSAPGVAPVPAPTGTLSPEFSD